MAYQHAELAAGRWATLSLSEQLGNIGSEISRAAKWRESDPSRYESAVTRALELFDLTLSDSRWKESRRLREIARAREVVCDAYTGGHEYGSDFASLQKYFDRFAFAARAGR